MSMTIEALAHIEAIKQLKARYFRFMDTKQWDDLALVFTEDAEIDVSDDVGEESGHVRGRLTIADFIRQSVEKAQTVHHGHMPEINLIGPDRAEGIWAMFDYVEFPSEEKSRSGLKGYGHYHETYVQRDDRWQIKSMRLVRLRVDSLT